MTICHQCVLFSFWSPAAFRVLGNSSERPERSSDKRPPRIGRLCGKLQQVGDDWSALISEREADLFTLHSFTASGGSHGTEEVRGGSPPFRRGLHTTPTTRGVGLT